MAELLLRGVSKVYASGVTALAPFSLRVDDGQFIVLVGPSGCGKTTLLRIIAGLEHASDGLILLDGDPLTAREPGSRDVAMVFQNYALYPHLTVRANLGFPLKMHGVPSAEREARVQEVAQMLGLDSLLERKPTQLSGGQQQRVALGRAIVRRPKLFLLDEPFSNLDATLRAKTRIELLRLHRRLRATTLFVTHDQVEAMTMADVLVVLKDGKVQQIGQPMEVYRRPANLFVAQFIGFPPMNLLRVERNGQSSLIRVAGYALPHLVAPAQDTLVLGIRPEHLQLLPPVQVAKYRNTLPAKVMFLEPLGNETLATCVAGGQDIVVRVPAVHTIRPGQEVYLAIDEEAVVWFDGASGDVLESDPVLT